MNYHEGQSQLKVPLVFIGKFKAYASNLGFNVDTVNRYPGMISVIAV